MTDELKHKFEQLVADAPPPTGVPSEGVFERVRAVKRRRRATAGILATAAVVAAAIAAGNLTNLNSAPAPAYTPGPTPVVTGPPTVSATTTPPPTGKSTIGGSVNTLPPVGNTDEPPQSDPSSPGTSTTRSHTPPATPVQLNVALNRTINSSKVTAKVTESGTVIIPGFDDGPGTVTSGNFHKNLLYVSLQWGDGTSYEPDVYGGIGCYGSLTKRITGRSTTTLGTHTYAKPGLYKLTYKVSYCAPGDDFARSVTKTSSMTVPEGDKP